MEHRLVFRFVRSVVDRWFVAPRTTPLWQRAFFLVSCSVLRSLLASERSGVVKTFRCRALPFFMHWTLLPIAIGFSLLGAVTLYFSRNRELFIRIFIPFDELRDSIPELQDDAKFRRGIGWTGILQLVVGIAFGIAALICWIMG